MKVTDYLRSYPSVFSRDYQSVVSSKKEFNSLRSVPTEDVPKTGEYYLHQELTHRILAESDDMLILSETGTGKSGEVLGFCDKVITEIEREKVSPGSGDERLAHFRRIFVISGSVQMMELKHQLVCKINPERYYRNSVKMASLDIKEQKKQQRAEVTRTLNTWFTFATYESFGNMVKELSNEILMRDYTHSIFWIDEAHNLIITYEDEEDGSSQAKQQKRNETLAQYDRLFSLPYCKRILTTATPMMNDSNDFVSFFNLLLPSKMPYLPPETLYNMNELEWRTWFPDLPRENVADYSVESYATMKRFFRGKIPVDTNMDTISEEQLEVYLRGRVSYIRALDTGADIIYVGLDPNTFQPVPVDAVVKPLFTLDMGLMSDFQKASYLREEEKGISFNIAKLQSATFVYPDGSYKDENNRYISRAGEEIIVSQELADSFRNNGVAHHSWKYNNIAKAFASGERRSIFVYVPFVNGAGVFALAACLQSYGLTRFNFPGSIFEGTDGSTGGFCSLPGKNSKRVSPAFWAQKGSKTYYAMLTRETPKALRNSIMEVFYSEENAHGDIIRGILVTRVGRDGISLNNVTEAFFPYSEYNVAALYQAMSRIMRATSFVTLCKENPDKRIEVKVHLMCSGYYNSVGTPTATYEKAAYELAFNKENSISRIMRCLEKAAVGCNINYNRNVRATDVPGSAVCRYRECQYRCFQQPYAEVDQSTYNIFFIEKEVRVCVDYLKMVFGQFMFLTLAEIYHYCQKHSRVVVDKALSELTSNKEKFMNVYGVYSFLYEDYAGFHVSSEYSFDTVAPNANWYTSNLLCNDKVRLLDYTYEIERTNVPAIMNRLRTQSLEFRAKDLRALPTAIRSDIYEECFSYMNPLGVPRASDGSLEEFIFNFYNNYLFVVPDMSEIGKREATRERKGNITFGRNTDKVSLLKIAEENDRNLASRVPYYYVHILDSISDSKKATAMMSKYVSVNCNPRIYEVSYNNGRGGWREANPYEKLPIVNVLQGLIYRKLIAFNGDPPSMTQPQKDPLRPVIHLQYTYYATILNGIFRVACVDNWDPYTGKTQDGKECKDMVTYEQCDLLFSYAVRVPYVDFNRVNNAYTLSEQEKRAYAPSIVEYLNLNGKMPEGKATSSKKVAKGVTTKIFTVDTFFPFLVYAQECLRVSLQANVSLCHEIQKCLIENGRVIQLS